MIYLLDVNSLIGLGYVDHAFHSQSIRWIKSLDPKRDSLASCAITEIGFIRILSLPTTAGFTIEEAKVVLREMKATSPVEFRFIADGTGANALPVWVERSAQTTDGHLTMVAKSVQGTLATFDRKIPGAFLIPA